MFRVKSQPKRLARPMYSTPTVHGARIVANVVDPAMFNEWKAEIEMMAGRIIGVRQKLLIYNLSECCEVYILRLLSMLMVPYRNNPCFLFSKFIPIFENISFLSLNFPFSENKVLVWFM